jgi:hypothetical protein
MAVTDCESCGNRVNVEAMVCPHCGARRTNVARPKLNKDEVRALIATGDAVADEAGQGITATLLFPHPETTGAARTIEIILTIACAPLVLVGIASMMLGRRSIRRAFAAARGELMSVVAMTFFGGFSFWAIIHALKVPASFEVTIISIMLLWVRAYIRSRTQSWRSRELNRLVKAEKDAAAPKLPPARALPTGPSPVVRPSAPIQAPKPDSPTPAGDEPRLLR